MQHSPIVAWVRDGFPIYGPYGYAVSNNPAREVLSKESLSALYGLPVDAVYSATTHLLAYPDVLVEVVQPPSD